MPTVLDMCFCLDQTVTHAGCKWTHSSPLWAALPRAQTHPHCCWAELASVPARGLWDRAAPTPGHPGCVPSTHWVPAGHGPHQSLCLHLAQPLLALLALPDWGWQLHSTCLGSRAVLVAVLAVCSIFYPGLSLTGSSAPHWEVKLSVPCLPAAQDHPTSCPACPHWSFS